MPDAKDIEFDRIIVARHLFMQRHPHQTPRIMINPHLLQRYLGMKNFNGHYYVHVDPFDKTKWSLLGMTIIEDKGVNEWEIF